MTAALGLPGLRWPAETLDEMILLVYPLRMLGGDLPHRDFFSAYGPGHWWLLEAVFGLFTPSLLVTRLLGVLIHVGVALAVYALALRAGRLTATLCAVLSALLLFKLGDAPYAWVTTAMLCLWQVVLLHGDGRSRRAAFLAGLMAGLALSVRPDALPLAVLPALPGLIRRGRWLPWFSGLGTGLLPLLVGIALSPSELVDDIALGRAGGGAGQSRLPLLPDSQAAQELLLVMVVGLVLLVVHARIVRSRQAWALVLLGVAALPQALQRVDVAHLTYAAVVFLPLLPAVLHGLATRLERSQVIAVAAGCSLVLLGMAGSSLYPLAQELRGKGPETSTVRHDGRSLLVTEDEANELREVLAAVERHSTAGETLFVFDKDLSRPALNDVRLYFLLPQLRDAARHVEVTPGITNAAGSGLAEDVRRADVIVLLDLPAAFRHKLFPYEREGSHEADQALSAYCQVEKVSYFEVYRRCGSGS